MDKMHNEKVIYPNVADIQGTVYPFVSIGKGINKLDAFDDAEVNAGIISLNAIRFTSFVPVGPFGRWKIGNDIPILKNGESMPMAYEYACSINAYVSAAIAIGLNEDEMKPGLIMEYAEKDIDENKLEMIAIDAIERGFSRRKEWKLDRIITRKTGVQPDGKSMYCAMTGALYIPYCTVSQYNYR